MKRQVREEIEKEVDVVLCAGGQGLLVLTVTVCVYGGA